MFGILLFAFISALAMFNFAHRGDQDSLQNLTVVKRMKAQVIVIGRVRDAIRNPLRKEKEKYDKLAKMVEELGADKNESE